MQIVFLSKYARLYVKPLGADMTVHKNGRNMIEPRPIAQFNNGKFVPSGLDMQRAMVEHKNFGQPWGWSLAAGCLPDEIARAWPRLGIEKRRECVLLLLDGKEKQAKEAAVEEVEKVVAAARGKMAIRDKSDGKWGCTIDGCNSRVTGKNRKDAMQLHFAVKHPELPKELANVGA